MASSAFAIVVCFETETMDRFLVALHEDRGWELPGGTVEAGESALEAGVREFEEEIGHTVDAPQVALETSTPEGPCTVVTGRMGDPVGVAGEESIATWRFVESLAEVDPLAWPEDPYEEIGEALGVSLA